MINNASSCNVDEDSPPLTLCEIDDQPSLEWLSAARRLPAGNLLIGAGGAMLVHLLALLLTLISPLMYAHKAPQGGGYVAVSLVHLPATSNLGNGKPGDGASRVKADSGSHEEISSPQSDALVFPMEPDTVEIPPAKIAPPDEAHVKETVKKPITRPRVKAPSKTKMRAAPAVSRRAAASSPFPPPTPSQQGSRRTESDTPGGIGGSPGGPGSNGAGPGSGPPGLGSSSGAAPIPSEFHVNQVDVAPRLVHKVEPPYPFMARRNGVCGKVTVKLLVGIDGRVSRPSIVEAEPKGIFEQSVLEVIQKWKFKPGVYHGKSVATWIILPFQFKLSG